MPKTSSGSNQKILEYARKVKDIEPLPNEYTPDFPIALDDRINQYYDICAEFDMKPTFAGVAQALHIDREDLKRWRMEKFATNKSVRDILDSVYQLLNSQIETYVLEGKIDATSAKFVMKNNFNYQDVQERVVAKIDTALLTKEELIRKANELPAIEADYKTVK